MKKEELANLLRQFADNLSPQSQATPVSGMTLANTLGLQPITFYKRVEAGTYPQGDTPYGRRRYYSPELAAKVAKIKPRRRGRPTRGGL